MSKDVIIAGAIAVGCIALIAVAFIAPKSKSPEPEAPKTEITPLVTDTTSLNGLGTDPLNPGGVPPIGGQNTTGLPPIGGQNTGLPPIGGQNTTGLPPISGPGTGLPHTDPFGQAPLPMPAPVTIEAPAPVSESKTHTVASGELLGDIALKYYGSSKSWKKIQEANPGVDPKNLKVGQKLVIPGVAPKPTTDAGAPVVAGPGEKTYTVKKGDSLYSIAQKELGSAAKWKEIQKLNSDVSSSDLKIGQTLKLPVDATAPVIGAPTASGKTHSVAKGETLGDISAKYFKTSKNWKKIQEANPGVSPENLKVGQKLIIPDTEAAVGTATSDTASGEYVVKAGDTFSIIAQKELGSKNKWKEIQEANPGIDSRNLRTGQKLKIPGKAAAPIPAPVPAPVPNFGTPNNFGAPNSGLGAPSNTFGAPANNGLGAPNTGLGGPGTFEPAPLGAPTGSLNTPAAPFGSATDPGFNSPYGNGAFGQPTQPFNQTGPGFSQTGAAAAPAPSQFGQPIPAESTLR